MSNDGRRLHIIFTESRLFDNEPLIPYSRIGAPSSLNDESSSNVIPGSKWFNSSSIISLASGDVLMKNTSHFAEFSVNPDSVENSSTRRISSKIALNVSPITPSSKNHVLRSDFKE